MDHKIKILTPEITHKIAAGEVVERPASVVKELVENSLDAGASQIEISLTQGGKHLIKVSDNGIGMGPQDAVLSLERHATSKIKCEEDLFAINSLGFRGEALSSIAAVSRLTLTTRTQDSLAATRIAVEGGKIKETSDCGAPVGTTLEIQDLFFNVPARAKFLRTAATELGNISKLVGQQSLAYLQVGFKLIHQQRELLALPKVAQLTDRMAAVYGLEFVESLLPVNHAAGELKIEGYVSSPRWSSAGREHQVCFINRRLVRDKIISQAIYQAYGSLLPKDRQPGWVIFIEMPVGEVDVNVHPAKTEVRFAQPQALRQMVVQGLSRVLGGLGAVLIGAQHVVPLHEVSAPESGMEPLFPPDMPETAQFSEPYQQRVQQAIMNYTETIPSLSPINWGSTPPINRPVPGEGTTDVVSRFIGNEVNIGPNEFIANLVPIGQFQDSFILCQNNRELIIIDQHAAHEKVLFEKLLGEMERNKIPVQPLLIPINMELTVVEEQVLSQHEGLLTEAGFEITPFGGRTYILRSSPAIIPVEELANAMKDILAGLEQNGKVNSLEQLHRELAAKIACHAAIKINRRLEPQEITHLLQALSRLKLPLSCPHGRPTILRYSLDEMYKYFLRGKPA